MGPGSARPCDGRYRRSRQWPGRERDGQTPSGECGYSGLPCPTTDAKEPRTTLPDHPKNKRPPCPPVFPAVGRPLENPGRPGRIPAGAAPILLRDLADNPGTDGPAAFANGEAQTSSIAIGAISLTPIVTLSPGMTISVPRGGSLRRSRRWCGSRMRAVVSEERRVTATFVLRQHVDFGAELGGADDRTGAWPGLATLDAVARRARAATRPRIAGFTASSSLGTFRRR